MAECILLKGGNGGLDPDELTAAAAQVLEGYLAGVKGVDEPVAGTMANNGVTKAATYVGMNTSAKYMYARFPTGYYCLDENGTQNPYISMPYDKVASAIGLKRDKLMDDTTILGITGTIENHTGTPTKINYWRIQNNRFEVAVPKGFYWCSWDSNSYEYMEFADVASCIGLSAAKLLKGQTVCGVAGTATSDATAVAANILKGKTAYVNGNKVTGTIESLAGGTKTPTTSAQTIACSGKYMTSDITIPAFSLPPANKLLKGYSYTIYGKTVTGTAESYVSTPSAVFSSGAWGSGLSADFTTNSGLLTIIKSGNVYVTSSTAGATEVYFRTNCAVNLSSYKYIKSGVILGTMYNTGTCSLKMCVSTSPNFSGYVATTSAVSATGTTSTESEVRKNATIVADVSSLSGMYYIYYIWSAGSSVASANTAYIKSITLANS